MPGFTIGIDWENDVTRAFFCCIKFSYPIAGGLEMCICPTLDADEFGFMRQLFSWEIMSGLKHAMFLKHCVGKPDRFWPDNSTITNTTSLIINTKHLLLKLCWNVSLMWVFMTGERQIFIDLNTCFWNVLQCFAHLGFDDRWASNLHGPLGCYFSPNVIAVIIKSIGPYWEATRLATPFCFVFE